ncbi:ScbA/BarX family gamma-butyrolactone biosynthesis protein [Streptomyces sp. NPDC001568]|uniref:ScbA/BarX family gamma-butyrolactone biosynthesis protein n=1 Tax=Streptomyces sp. NPDC001568 TaxID=3364588 RepID=UPI00369974EF
MTLLTFENNIAAPSNPRTGGGQWTTRCNDIQPLTSTVPREYVHRSAIAEVFLTGYERLGDEVFRVTAQWPRAHSFFTTSDGLSHDPVQAAETIRQSALLLAHAEYGVPLTHNALVWSLGFKTEPSELLIGANPSDLELIVVCRDFAWQGNRFSGFIEVTVRRGNRVAATGTGLFSCVSPAVYRRLRGTYAAASSSSLWDVPRPAPIPAASAGRVFPTDVVLSPGDRPGRWLLNPHFGHPVLFEHPNDHQPGMVLIEAARQAACGVLEGEPFRPTGIETFFHNYAEFEIPCWIETEIAHSSDPDVRVVQVTGRQGDVKTFEATVTGTVADH